jgi:hypothetical protein
MKNKEYLVKGAFTKSHFVATKCNCKAGCSNILSSLIHFFEIGQGRILCSHRFLVPVVLSLVLYKNLASHILSELWLHSTQEDVEDLLSSNQLTMIQQGITFLLRATGRTESAMDKSKSILQTLHMFSVGTDKPSL